MPDADGFEHQVSNSAKTQWAREQGAHYSI